jgi:hypothetical protein
MALQGNEILFVTPVQSNGQLGAILEQTTTGAVAALGSSFSNDSPVSVTTATGTTLTAANLLKGVINRTGTSAAFTDTTDTAANIYAAVGQTGFGFYVIIKNGTPYTQTLAGGTGVTFSSSTVVPPNSYAYFLVTVTSSTASVFNHVFTGLLTNNTPLAVTGLSTVGAGTITGAGIAGGYTGRTGSQSNTAFTDTTDTADNIIAAQANAHIGMTWVWQYRNNTNATATIAGGTGVTVSTTVPAFTSKTFLVTYTAASTITMTVISANVTPFTVNGTFTANGATAVVVADTNITANSVVMFGLKTVGGTPAGAPFMSAVTPGTGFSVKAAAGDTSVYNYLIIN